MALKDIEQINTPDEVCKFFADLIRVSNGPVPYVCEDKMIYVESLSGRTVGGMLGYHPAEPDEDSSQIQELMTQPIPPGCFHLRLGRPTKETYKNFVRVSLYRGLTGLKEEARRLRQTTNIS